MIQVLVLIDDVDVGRIDITNVRVHEDETADYAVEFGVDRVWAVGLHRRVVRGFPRLKYNVLALLKQALETLDEKELELEQETSASDLAWRLRGIGY